MNVGDLERSLQRLAGPPVAEPSIAEVSGRMRRRRRARASTRTLGAVVLASGLTFALGQMIETRSARTDAPAASARLPEPAAESAGLFDQLVSAVRRDDAASVAILVQAGADPTDTVRDGITPLMIAAFRGDVETVEVLLATDAGDDVDRANDFDATALRLAAQQGHVDAVGSLVDAGADVNRLSSEAGAVSPLMEAARFGQREAVEALLALGADPHVVDGRGRPTTFYALDALDPPTVLEVFREEGVVIDHPGGDPARAIVFADRSVDDLWSFLTTLDVPARLGEGGTDRDPSS